MPVEREELLTWLMLSEGAGFTCGTATIEVIGPDGLTIRRRFINGAKFHNGQIVDCYELAKNATREEAEAYLESKRSHQASGAEFPVGGMGLHYALRDRKSATRAKAGAGAGDVDYNEYVFALTLAKMRGHEIAGFTPGHTAHLFTWVINHDDTLRYLGTSLDEYEGEAGCACHGVPAFAGMA
jgi:hypothetical protein